MQAWWAAFAALALCSCLQAASISCGDGRVCPAKTTCDRDLHICIADGQRTACDGLIDKEPCEFRGASGRCKSGVCVATVCGDGIVEGAEECDGENLGVDSAGSPQTCASIGYDMGTLACNKDCTYNREDCAGICGDGNVDPDEDCENGVAQTISSCKQLGYYDDKPVGCNAVCRYDASGCTGFCGDGVKNGAEDCDGAVAATTTCQSVGFYSTNSPACNAACRFDTATCSGSCGDQLLNGPEVCDGTPPVDTCTDLGYTAGVMSCSTGCTPNLPSCIRGSWRRIGSYPTFGYFFDMWGPTPDNIYLVGDYGAFHWNGAKVEAVAGLPTFTQGLAVWGSSANDVWIFGYDSGGVRIGYHFNGSAWSAVATPRSFDDVWGSAANDVYGVGSDGVYHYDGTAWTQILADTGFIAVHGTAANDVWIVGYAGAVKHFDGTSWATVDPGTTKKLLAVFALSPTNVYVGGTDGLHHMVGTTWTPELPGVYAEAVIALSPTNVWASEGIGTIYHFDGTTWTQRPHPDNLDCEGLLTFDGALYEIGDENNLYKYDGLLVRSFPGVTTKNLRAVWGDEHAAFAVGQTGTILKWDGMTWSTMTSPTTTDLVAVWGSSPSDVYAAGAGVMVHYTAGSWQIVSGLTGNYTELWGSGPNDIYAAAFHTSTPQHWDGNSWAPLTPLASGFSSVWGTGQDDVYVGFMRNSTAPSSAFRHWNGSTWSALSWTGQGRLDGIGSTVVAHNEGDQYANSDSTWRAHDLVSARTEISAHATSGGSTLNTVTLGDIHVSGPGDILAVGKLGTILRYDGATWWPIASGVTSTLNAIDGRGRSAFTVGDGGAIVQITFDDAVPACTTTGAEQDCANNLDDDCDFLVDDHDPDCRGTGLCWAPRDITCGSSTNATFGGGYATVRNYSCSTKLRRGLEDVYRLVPPTNGSLTVSLTGISEDIDLYVVGATSTGACDPAGRCLAASETSSMTAPEQATVSTTANEPVFVLIDSDGSGQVTTYTLQVTCN